MTRTTAPHHLSTRRQVPSDDDLLAEYGPLIWDFLLALASDVGLMTELVEAANRVDRRAGR